MLCQAQNLLQVEKTKDALKILNLHPLILLIKVGRRKVRKFRKTKQEIFEKWIVWICNGGKDFSTWAEILIRRFELL